jgi:ketosteroid isomerase-like protein
MDRLAACVLRAAGPPLVMACAACGASPRGGVVTAVEIPDAPRRPDGVVVEPAPAMPEAAEHAEASGVVALREPLADEAVAGVVRAMFRAFAREDAEALAALLTSDAEPLGVRGHARGSLLDQWRTRMRNLPYDRLGSRDVARFDQLERWSFADLDGAGPVERPSDMRPGDVLVRVPVATPRVDGEQLFGDVVLVLLRREGATFKIAGESEDAGPQR